MMRWTRRSAPRAPNDSAATGPRVWPVAGVLAMACIVANFSGPVAAQDGSGAVPDDATARRYGSGWDCDVGFQVKAGACIRTEIPENAFATGKSYGSGWACRRGYEEDGGACRAIPIPENAYLHYSGYGWQCERGYRKVHAACVLIELPENAFLTEEPSETGWRCERGYEARNGGCAQINLPENAHLDRSGNAWRCDQSFQLANGQCVLGR